VQEVVWREENGTHKCSVWLHFYVFCWSTVQCMLLSTFSFLLAEFSFMRSYYHLLYQSIIPNCELTIKLLRQDIEIVSEVENFLVNEESSRVRCQRIINVLLVHLNNTKDYKMFCHLLDMITVMSGLVEKLRAGTTK